MKPTQEQVIAWAREAGASDTVSDFNNGRIWLMDDEELQTAFTLAYEAGRKDENEACVEVIKPNATPMEIAAAIRARREQ